MGGFLLCSSVNVTPEEEWGINRYQTHERSRDHSHQAAEAGSAEGCTDCCCQV